jgi:Do/DeqQ family serine protease
MKRTLSLLIFALLGGFAGAFVFEQTEPSRSISAAQQASMPVSRTLNAGHVPNTGYPDFTYAAEQTVHGVVHVKTYYTGRMNPFDPFSFWGRPAQPQQQESSGSGVIITEDGFIITNNHVVENAEKVEVTLNDNRSFPARVIGTDPSTDLALLKIEENKLPFIPYGNSDELKVGEWVLAVGNPFNLTSTVTAGIVSAKGRNIGILPDQFKIESFIQTDAAVNPGNSGGALVNTRGELIGINSAIASNTGSYTGYSFAIPSNLVRKVIDDLAEFGNVQRAFIGVSIRDLDAKLAEEKGLKVTQGVYVSGLTDGGAAANAGITEGDIIVRVGDVAINSTPQLQEQIGRFRPGDKVNLTVIRNGKEKPFTLTLRNREGETTLVQNDGPLNLLGATFIDAGTEEKQRLGLSGGVKVTKLTSGKLLSSGVREGFIITSIDKKPVVSTEDLSNALKTKQGGVLLEGIYPNGLRAYYGFGL